jgi:hypothetical protein
MNCVVSKMILVIVMLTLKSPVVAICTTYFNTLKLYILPTQFICVFRTVLTGNTLRLRYKAQPVNAVWGNSRCLL